MQDKPYRSIIKAFSYRLTGTLATIMISFLISGRIKIALSIGVIELVTKIALYYLHERAWNRIPFGRVKERPPEYSI